MDIVDKIARQLGSTFNADVNSQLEGDSPPLEGCPQDGVVKQSQDKRVLTHINNTPIIRNFVGNLPYNPALKQLAKDKRKAGILSEVLFWQQVHKRNFYEIDFDRQRIIGNYIVDFYVKTLGLIVEIGGSSHDNKTAYDNERQAYFESLGLKVFRIADGDVKQHLGEVMDALEDFIVKEYGEESTSVFDHPFKEREESVSTSERSLHVGVETTPAYSHPSKGGKKRDTLFGYCSREGEFAPIDMLDYIYALLHSRTYREKYKEFLKIDFPRVTYPKNQRTFWNLVELGGELRELHLQSSLIVNKYSTHYPVDGSNIVSKVKFENSRVYINETQYFDLVPETAWTFYIRGYQPAQKWLKDRKDRTLDVDDILHYQKIIVAVSETYRIIKEIDKIKIE